MFTSPTILRAALAAALASGLTVGEAPAQPYPRPSLYGQVSGNGAPFVRADGSLDTLEIGRVARFPVVALDVFAITPYRPEVLAALRARNPSIRLIAYALATDIINVNDADSLNHIPTIIRHTVRDLNGFLYDRVTGGEFEGTNINLAKRDLTGRYVVAQAMADIFRDRILATGQWDGLFTDLFPHTVSWMQNGTGRVIDLAKAGYPSLAALDAAWSEAADLLASRLRSDGGPGFLLVGNSGPSAEHAWYNGWMRENFPNQQGGTWASNMLGDVSSRGVFRDDQDFVQPPLNWILSWATATPGTEHDRENSRRVRLGLGSSALSEAVAAFLRSRRYTDGAYQDWWYDEYAVDLTTGRSSESQQHTGWLGDALGPAYVHVWPGTAPDVVTNNGFEADVTTGWTFAKFAPAVASIARDASTAAVGSASARITVSTPSTVEWHTYLQSTGQLTVFSGSSCSATFWCKADPPRRIHVVAGNSGGQRYIDVDGTWRQYQAVLQPLTSMSAPIAFWLGTEAGDVWFDDVHFQSGVSSVWRRDFHNGSVLVNPTERSLEVPLTGTFRRILGVHDPGTNTGATGSTMTLPPNDALFLLRGELDSTRPASVKDLRVGP